MKFLFSNILLFSLFVANAQTIKGTIIDAATGKGIGGASISNAQISANVSGIVKDKKSNTFYLL